MCSRPSSRCRNSLNRVLGSYLFAIGRIDMPLDERRTEGLKEWGSSALELPCNVDLCVRIYKGEHLPNVSMQRIREFYLCYHTKGST